MISDLIQVQLRERVRLDVFLTRRLAQVSRHRIQRHIRAGDVLVDGRPVRPSHVLLGGETIALPPIAARKRALASEAVDFEIVHEDADLVVVNKPAGLVVHQVGREFRRTLLNGLHHRLHARGEDSSALGIVHRLDRLTSGLLVVAKTMAARRALSADAEHHRMQRQYLALTAGAPSLRRGRIEYAIRRDPARPTRMQAVDETMRAAAIVDARRPFVSSSGYSDPRLDLRPRSARTRWRVLRRFDGAALVQLELETGRTHQIRVHAQAAGWPLLGDPLYGPDATLAPAPAAVNAALQRPALHAAMLEFTHPVAGRRLRFRAALPDDLRRAIGVLGFARRTP
jgi:23S rRNA pseudouridine1911/1915/1917 synthase